MTAPTFLHKNPNQPEFWDERFAQQFTPWHQTQMASELQDFIATQSKPLHTLVPGCGHANDVALFIQADWPVTALDFSAQAIQQARTGLAELISAARASVTLVQADFFQHQPSRPYDLIFERAFFCALPPLQRAAIVAKWRELLAPGALLAGFFYLQTDAQINDDKPRGPPFICAEAEWLNFMQNDFELIAQRQSQQSLPVFAGHEYWQVWRKKVSA